MRTGRAKADLWVQLRRHPMYTYSAEVVKVTKRRPIKPEPGAVVVRVAVDVPLALFSLEATATVTLPEDDRP
ncbi:hypothetical protein [Jiangella gansuensis]|uniref:hypothetical protein n=1 Tax=Jiangella gansuensis TaxID=281473 RepID=UPI000479D59E|nr:hypothetical protein [Jiangella gansuensis]